MKAGFVQRRTAVCQPLQRGIRGLRRYAAPPVGSMRHCASVPATRPAKDFTPRIVPFHRDAFVPLEAPDILWRRQYCKVLGIRRLGLPASLAVQLLRNS
jgi:hypothetical protein